MDNVERIEVEEGSAYLDTGPGGVLSFPAVDRERYSEADTTVFVSDVEYDSGGRSDLDGTEPIMLQFVSVFSDEDGYEEMRSEVYLTQDQAQRIGISLLETGGIDIDAIGLLEYRDEELKDA